MAISSFWVHFILIGLDLVGEIVVVWGIIWENPKQPEHRHEIAGRLIIGGTVLAIFCTICLFSYDEHLSQLQDDKIASQGDTIKHLGEVAAKAKSDADAASGAAQTAIANASDAAFVASSAQSRATATSDEIDRMTLKEKTLRAEIKSDEDRIYNRSLNKRQYDIIQSLKGKVPKIGLAWAASCTDCAMFSAQLSFAFGNADISLVEFPGTAPSGAANVMLYAPPEVPPAEQQAIIDALTRAKLYGGNSRMAFPGAASDLPVLVISERWAQFRTAPYFGPRAK
jgi:hypothetical protein